MESMKKKTEKVWKKTFLVCYYGKRK